MWKKNITTLIRSSIPLSRNSNFSIPNQIHHHPFSSSSNPFANKTDLKYFPPQKVLFFRNPLIGLTNTNESRLANFFCSQPQKIQCWNCGNASPLLFCEFCRSVQPVDHSVDYFQIFGLRREYNVKVEELEGKYKDWQKKLHPDLVHTKSQKEREYAADQSARVTNAYRTLCDPLARAVYMVKLQGVPHDTEETITDPELLAEIMELREDVEEAEGTEALNQIQSQLTEKLLYWSKSFEDAFLSKKYDDALASVSRMTYYRRANEEIVKKQ